MRPWLDQNGRIVLVVLHVLIVLLSSCKLLTAWKAQSTVFTRRNILQTTLPPSLGWAWWHRNPAVSAGAVPPQALADPQSLASRLVRRDPEALKNRLFNVPPAVQVYPAWMRGSWNMTLSYQGYLFPSERISRQRLTQDYEIPGFQKCSIALTADVGREATSFLWTIDPQTGWEDRSANLAAQINAYLSYRAVDQVLYQPRVNPNRISIDFVDYRTVNAERIELFGNARESQEYQLPPTKEADTEKIIPGSAVFVCSEYLRQVTFGTGSTVGIPRQVVTNYAHFWTFFEPRSDVMQGNLLTAAYLDPQDALYFEEPARPVAIYSHTFEAKRL